MYAIIVRLLNPYLLFMLLQFLALVALWRRRERRTFALWLLTTAFLGEYLLSTRAVAYVCAEALERAFPPLPERPAAAEAIVVLGGGVFQYNDRLPQSPPSWTTERRCLEAAELYRAGPPCPVVVAGGIVDPSKPVEPEGEVMARLLERLGVARDDMLIESRSRDTYENAVFSQTLLDDRGIKHIILVTDATHLSRAVACFERLGYEVTPAGAHYDGLDPPSDFFDYLPGVGDAEVTARVVHEWLGWAWYRLKGRI